MQQESSEDLLVIITMQEDEPEAAQQAFHEFHRRFKKYVWSVSFTLSRTISSPNPDDVANDIFNDTFLDVYRNYQSKGYFDSKHCTNIEKGIKNWLTGISRNHLKRYIETIAASSRLVPYLDACPDRPFFDLDDKEKSFDSPKLILLQRALETVLNKKEREVLLISVQFEEEGRLPKELKKQLCKAYGVVPDTLRQIKKRAKEKVEGYMQKHGFPIYKKTKTNV